MTKFSELMERLGVNMGVMYVSLVVFSAHIGRKLSINSNSQLYRYFPYLSGLKTVSSMDDQNNVLRFARYQNGELYMHFILNRNGVVLTRYFTEPNKEFDPATLDEMREEIQHLVRIVMSIS